MEQRNQELLKRELYFLLQKFLAVSPLTETYKVLSRELQQKQILPVRYDWEGNKHERTFEDLERLYPHIGPNHLLEICGRIGPILDKDIPPCIKGVQSLLGSGRQSLLREADSFRIPYLTRYYASRQHGMPICDPFNPKVNHNISHILAGREISGPVPRQLAFPPTQYAHLQLQVQTLGHLSAVYCLLFDKAGKYIITGADDLLIKLWSAHTGRLINSFRGASAEITDIDINLENTLLAAGSIDRILRIWDLQTGAPIAVLTSHTGTITSVHFCPSSNYDVRYVATTSSDGSVAFWPYNYVRHRATFSAKPILYQEKMRPGQSQMICSSFSPGGTFLAAGSADHYVRVYLMRGDEGPIRILETEVHSDRVDSIVWAHRGLRFVSGSKDGTAFIWHFERQHWKFQKLAMDTKLAGAAPVVEEEQHPPEAKKPFVTMVAWDNADDFIITAVSDNCLKVWQAATGQLQRVLTGHTDGVYVLEAHPKDPHVMLSTGHDGLLFVWDVLRGTKIVQYTNTLDNGQGQGAVFDAKWSPDGSMFAASDSHGHLMIYAFGTDNPQFKMLPKEMFFHTDYRPLVRDADHTVLDEQTQVPPHLMPPPFLVDIDGNPYPPMLQRLVPGREHCTSEQLVPNIVIGTGGRQEVIQGLNEAAPRSDIDRMIAALAQRQYGNDDGDAASAEAPAAAVGNAPRRSGEASVEGIRQSTGDWQRDTNFVWSRKVLIQPLGRSDLEMARNTVETVSSFEMLDYQRENKKRPLMINTATTSTSPADKARNRRRRNGNVNTRRTRRANPTPRVAEPEQDGDDGDDVDVDAEESNNSTTSNSDDSTAKEEDLSLSDSSSDTEESSGYSDWVADQGENLEPPKRSKRKPAAHPSIHADDMPGTSSSKPKAKRIPPSKLKNGEIPEAYKDMEWLSKTVPRKAPYCPQMGDEVVYFVQGHEIYVNAVKNKKIYIINKRDLPWSKTKLRDKEFVKIVGIKYIIKPPRLCCLKLALLDEEQKLTDNVFTIKYHDMADVLDFIVLKQTYEAALAHSWNVEDRFRCMIDDSWWTGKIEAKTDYSDEHPGSLFMCYDVQWDGGEKEKMCPWDLEPIREDRLPETVGAAVPVLPDEIQSILYQPSVDEWPRGDRDAACRRIIASLDRVMELAIAEPFLAPVDLNLYPTYALVVEYPIDLSTIKARFENHFYRRIAAAQFDVRYLAANAEQFNEPHSVIVKSARIITDLCLRIIKQCTEDIDVKIVYHQLMDVYSSGSDEDDDADDARPGPSNGSTSRRLQTRTLRSNGRVSSDWRIEAKRLLEELFKMPDSAPFRQPVDTLKHPEYLQIIDAPMDLSTVREDLFGGNYETPAEFAKDMRLIFNNSMSFNTNSRSKIFAMTMRLAAAFEEQFQRITSSWRRGRREKNRNLKKTKRARAARAKSQESDNSEKENRYRRTRNANNRAANRRLMPSTSKSMAVTSDDDEDEENAMVDVERVPRPDSDDSEAACPRTQHESSEHSDDDEVLANHRVRRPKNVIKSDDSDYEPLSKYANSSNHKRKKANFASTTEEDDEEEEEAHASSASNDESSSSDSDSGIKKNLRPRSKRRRMQNSDDDGDGQLLGVDNDDTDSDNLPLKRYEQQASEDSAESDHVTSVSSRGRVRKLTEKARTLWKK